MKKVLALVVAFALCFTAFTGCFATSAAATLDNFAVSSVEVAADAEAAAVTVSGTYSGKAVQLLSVTLPAGVELASVEGADEFTDDNQEGDYIVTGNVVKFLTIPKDAFTYTLNVTFDANTSETDAVAYEVAADVQYALYDAEKPVIEYAKAKGTITVAKKAPEHTCTAVNYTDNGDGTHDATCDCVDNTLVADDEAHTFVDGVCKCGLDENISMLAPQVQISSTINVLFRATKASTTDKYASCVVVVNAPKYNKTTLMKENDIKPINLVELTPKNNGASYDDVSSYELDLPMAAYVVCYDANGVEVAHSTTNTYVPAEILKGMYKPTATEAVDVARNTIITEILNLGTAAQGYFGDQVANSDLSKATDMNDGFDQKFALNSYGDLENVENLNWSTDNPPFTSASNNVTKAVDIAGAPSIRYSILNATSTGKNPLDYSKLKLRVSYTTLYNTSSGNPEEVFDEIEGDEWNQYASGNHLRYTFKKLAMYDSNKVITAVITYEGKEVYSETFSVDTYILQKMNESSMTAVLTALARFNVSARNYFSADGSTV